MIGMSQMGQGNVPYNVAKRSVLGPIKRERRMGMGDGFGQTSASFDFGKGELVTVSSCCVMGSQAEDAVMYAFRQAENEMLAAGGELTGVRPMFLFPSGEEETLAAAWGNALDGLCRERGCFVFGIQAAGSQGVLSPVCMLTGYGIRNRECPKVLPGWDIVAVGHIGTEGIVMLTRGKRESLETRFAFEFIEKAASFQEELSIRHMMEALDNDQPVLVHALGEGGVFAGLWNLAERTGLGLRVRLLDIPVRQETVEISEFFELNPYQMMAQGMAFFVTEHGEDLAGRMRSLGIRAQVIGKMTDKKARVIVNGEEERFLDRPAADEMYKTGILV